MPKRRPRHRGAERRHMRRAPARSADVRPSAESPPGDLSIRVGGGWLVLRRGKGPSKDGAGLLAGSDPIAGSSREAGNGFATAVPVTTLLFTASDAREPGAGRPRTRTAPRSTRPSRPKNVVPAGRGPAAKRKRRRGHTKPPPPHARRRRPTRSQGGAASRRRVERGAVALPGPRERLANRETRHAIGCNVCVGDRHLELPGRVRLEVQRVGRVNSSTTALACSRQTTSFLSLVGARISFRLTPQGLRTIGARSFRDPGPRSAQHLSIGT